VSWDSLMMSSGEHRWCDCLLGPVKTVVTPVPSLLEMTLKAVCLIIDNTPSIQSVDEIPLLSDLPMSLQTDLRRQVKKHWQDNKLTPAIENTSTYEFRDIRLNRLDKHDFVMLMHHPVHIHPDIWPNYYESNGHVYFDFYKCQVGEYYNAQLRLCRQCFLKLSRPKDLCIDDDTDDTFFDYDAYWQQMGWKFLKCTWHCTIEPNRFICSLVKKETSWCDHCVLTPLFQLYTWESCTANTDAHIMDSNSDVDSEETFLYICDEKPIYNPYFHD
jgi:hypothetical protein